MRIALYLAVALVCASCVFAPLKQADLDACSTDRLIQILHQSYQDTLDVPTYRENKRMLRAEIVERRTDWVEPYRSAIVDGGLMIGMTTDQALIAQGRPNWINASTSANGASEQWVYRRGSYSTMYAYFDDGVLTYLQW